MLDDVLPKFPSAESSESEAEPAPEDAASSRPPSSQFSGSSCTFVRAGSSATRACWGAYAVIAQSLGLEVGGSVGMPRYPLAGVAVTMYIFGFREGWLFIFPNHPALLVDIATFAALYGIAYVSADFSHPRAVTSLWP